MSLTVARLIDRVQQLANRVDTSYRSRVRDAISRAQEDWALLNPWVGLKRVEALTMPGGRFMALPSRVARVITVSDVTDKRFLEAGDNWHRTFEQRWLYDTSGSPLEWREAGIVPLLGAPATDTRLQLTAGVSEVYNVYVTGLARDTSASGTAEEFYNVEETLQMAGTGATDTATTFVEVRTLQKTSDTVGDLVVRATTGSAFLARIPKRDSQSRYRRLEFQDVPAAGRVLRVEYYTRPEELVDEEQSVEPSVDEKFMLWRAVGDLHWINKEFDAAQAAWDKADQILAADTRAENYGERRIQPLPWWPDYKEFENVDTTDT